ncbi:MAG TPA: hypothetical protein VMI72_00600 [Roseiarcus sp.]|nr:hypothetical protein [Roseiarcus sp.]
MAFGFCAALALTTLSVVILPKPDNAITVALLVSSRVAFLFFWPAYAGGALTSLFGHRFLFLRKRARELGLAFAAALLVHLGSVLTLCIVGERPGVRTFIIFGAAALLTYLLALFSIRRVREAMPSAVWSFIRTFGMNYIALAFLLDFTRFGVSNTRDAVLYGPFAALAIAGPLLRAAAWAPRARDLLLRPAATR